MQHSDIIAECKRFDQLHNNHLDVSALLDIEIYEEEKRKKGIEETIRLISSIV